MPIPPQGKRKGVRVALLSQLEGYVADPEVAAGLANAAKALGRPELGSLKPGSVGDASVLSIDEGSFPLEDVRGEVVTADRRIFARGVVIAGRWWHPL